ncbi:acyl-CoA reductase-like NAD-dependent aldehyde dehydrogenase [Mycobacterium frederiksbergense]|uniref:Acyl-CoA reductase-like NAD-dependent aldehyde dehydrogenase n=1 Tax=Mycolicibacterium frederiksbergense TaxID=117567 RepID=A0ABT6KXZ6_9MYCO|nr:aldehyde dehydrogenase [Mycolicibacterium frederiksbergense]MDH6195578.1 acyl-CoA reductase-like NAD-dependent aldehyde dehydrogenase [Mycolicibacterium frederiksbergense]
MREDARHLVEEIGAIGPFVDGTTVSTDQTLDITCPATGKPFTSITCATAQMVDAAIEHGRRVFESGVWSRTDPAARAKVLHQIGTLLAERTELLAKLDALCTGRPIMEMRPQVGRLGEWFTYYAARIQTLEGNLPPFGSDFLNYVTREPLGVVAQVVTWNHPLLLLVKKLAPALAMGNSIVVKPSELTPITAVLLAQICTEAGVPPGVISVVPGAGPDVGAAVVGHAALAKVDFTGGTNTGRAIAVAAAGNLVPSTMELGGKAPVIVHDDADLTRALRGSLFAAFVASGQTCVSGTRFLVQRNIFDEFSTRFARAAATLRLGHPLDADSQVGPVISAAQLQRVTDAVDAARDAGATVLTGGQPPTLPGDLVDGYFYEPTVVTDVTREMGLWREEVFGPAVIVTPFDSEDDAVAHANDSAYGLGAAVWTSDLRRAHRTAQAVRAGVVWVNDHHKNNPASPWGGFGQSGYGRENGMDSLLAYSEAKSILVNLQDSTADWYGDDGQPKRYG